MVWLDVHYRIILKIPAHKGSIYAIKCIDNKIYTASRDKHIKVWDANTLDFIEKTDEFELLTFENEVVAISQKINGEIRNQRYLCAQHAAFSELIGLLEDRWSDYLLTMANKKKD